MATDAPTTAPTAPAPDAAATVAPPERVILAEVSRLLVQIIGEEYVLDLDIGMHTSFSADLELESIEFVTLATRLQERYGAAVDFVAFLADKQVGEIIELTVGEVVGFVAASVGVAGAR